MDERGERGIFNVRVQSIFCVFQITAYKFITVICLVLGVRDPEFIESRHALPLLYCRREEYFKPSRFWG